MNVILLEKITNLGDIGETADVKSGFARNFLFPQGKAIPATKANLADFESRKAELMAAHNENVKIAEGRKAKIDGLGLRLEVNASDEGKLFGSVGTKDIADAINSQVDAEVVKAEVLLPHGVIRELGVYDISIDLGYDVSAEIKLDLSGLDSPASVSDDGSVIEEIEAVEAEEIEAEQEAAEAEAEAEQAKIDAEVEADRDAEAQEDADAEKPAK